MNQTFKVLASGSKGNCYLLKVGEETLILECGIKWKEILQGLDYNLDNVVGCLVTHEHKDHSRAIDDMTRKGIDVYASKGTFRALGVQSHRLHVVQASKNYKIGNFTVRPFNTLHDTLEPLGFLIRHKDIGDCVFATDTRDVNYIFPMCPKNIFIECNFWGEAMDLDKRVLETHMSLEKCKDFLQFNKSKQLKHVVLLHLSDRNSNAALFQEEIQGVCGVPTFVAEKGLEINL